MLFTVAQIKLSRLTNEASSQENQGQTRITLHTDRQGEGRLWQVGGPRTLEVSTYPLCLVNLFVITFVA